MHTGKEILQSLGESIQDFLLNVMSKQMLNTNSTIYVYSWGYFLVYSLNISNMLTIFQDFIVWNLSSLHFDLFIESPPDSPWWALIKRVVQFLNQILKLMRLVIISRQAIAYIVEILSDSNISSCSWLGIVFLLQ